MHNRHQRSLCAPGSTPTMPRASTTVAYTVTPDNTLAYLGRQFYGQQQALIVANSAVARHFGIARGAKVSVQPTRQWLVPC